MLWIFFFFNFFVAVFFNIVSYFNYPDSAVVSCDEKSIQGERITERKSKEGKVTNYGGALVSLIPLHKLHCSTNSFCAQSVCIMARCDVLCPQASVALEPIYTPSELDTCPINITHYLESQYPYPETFCRYLYMGGPPVNPMPTQLEFWFEWVLILLFWVVDLYPLLDVRYGRYN